MKTEYAFYGKRTEHLIDKFSKKDKDLLEDYLTYCAVTAGQRKLKDYRRYMLQFRDVIEKPLDKITKKDAVGFWALVNHSPHEPNTKVMIKRTVKRFLKWHYKDLEMLEDLKSQSPVLNKKKINKNTLLKPEEIEKMLRATDSLRDKALLILLYETAARPQEVRDLKWKHINWDNDEVQLYSTKKEDDRSIPIKHALFHLKRWKQEWVFPDVTEEDFIFPSASFRMMGNKTALLPEREKHITTDYIDKVIKSLAKRAGIERRVYPYLLRHSRLSEIYNKGVKGQEHNLYAGHMLGSKQQHTYVHLDDDDMKNEVLDKVYNIKELTKEQKNKYDQKIEDQDKKIKKLAEAFMEFTSQTLNKGHKKKGKNDVTELANSIAAAGIALAPLNQDT